MDCAELETYLTDALEDELDPVREAALMAHLDRCEVCRAEYRAYREQEDRLNYYFKSQLERAAQARSGRGQPEPALGQESTAQPSRAAPWLAAASILVILGMAFWWGYRQNVPTGAAVLAQVKTTSGRVLVLREGRYEPAVPGRDVRQGESFKVAAGGYLALELNDGNIVEAREHTKFVLQDLPRRLVVEPDRGGVWAHLGRPPAKSFVVRTPQLTATAQGAVFAVEQGMDRTVVAVAEGAVRVEARGEQADLVPGETFNSHPEAGPAPLERMVAWSLYPEGLETLWSAGTAGSASAEAKLVVDPYEPETPRQADLDQAREATDAGATAAPITDLLDLLPAQTLYYLDVRDVPGIVEEFKQSDYSLFTREAALRQWWGMVRAHQGFREFADHTHLLELIELAGLIDGQVVVGVVPDSHVLLVADCSANEAAVDAILQRLSQESAQALSREHVRLAQGRLIVSNLTTMVQATAERLEKGERSGFVESPFQGKVRESAEQPRFVMAANLAGQYAAAEPKLDAEQKRLLDFTGVSGMNALIISPSFVGRGMMQAARLSFTGERYGIAKWLAEPAPMRALDFFSADIHFFGSAVLLRPREMLLDFLLFNLPHEDESGRRELERFFAEYEAFFDALGGEIAIGLDSPILPVPNLKIAVEIVDQTAFETHLDRMIERLLAKEELRDGFNYREVVEHKGRLIHSLVIEGLPIVPSWAYVDDFVVAGPGEQFVRDSIDVYESGLSIGRDSRLLSLMPDTGYGEVSMLVYQNIVRSVPQVMESMLLSKLSSEESELAPDLGFLGRYHAPGIAYALAAKS